MSMDVLERLANHIADGESEEALAAVEEALASGLSPLEVLDKGGTRGMDIVNERYDSGEAFLPELVVSGDTMTDVVQLIFSKFSAEEMAENKIGTVVIGQATGDVHDIGKNVVAALLAVNGFEIHNLGIDVPVKKFITEAEDKKADIIACSTLLTTSLPYMEDITKYLNDSGTRDKYFVILGGGPVTPEFAQKIGADGWARNAFDAVALCRKLVKEFKAGSGDFQVVDQEAQN